MMINGEEIDASNPAERAAFYAANPIPASTHDSDSGANGVLSDTEGE